MRIKKIGLTIVILAVFVLITSGIMIFGANSGDAAEYYPLHPGNTWIYKLSMLGNTQTVQEKIKVTDPEDGNPKIIIYDPKGNPRVFVYYEQNQQGLFKVKEMDPSGINQYHPLMPMLSAKMNVGTYWSWESDDHKMKETDKVTAVEKVTVPAGTFETILIECSGVGANNVAYLEKTWWAKGVGYVKDELTTDGNTFIRDLSEYQLVK
jgi:hypothetical protein